MNRMYVRLVRYFIILMGVTCLASLVLFFATIGRPLAKDFHQMLRNNVLYIGWNAGQLLEQNRTGTDLDRFVQKTARTYSTRVIILDHRFQPLADSSGELSSLPEITEEMQTRVHQNGIFVQSSHFQKPLVYLLALSGETHPPFYLYIGKKFPETSRGLIFLAGLVLLCGILILAVYPLARSLTKPLGEVTAAVREIAAGNLRPEIRTTDRQDELGDLVNAFGRMSASVDQMVASKKTLLADISHELRSPLTRLKIALELIRSEVEKLAAANEIQALTEDLEYEADQMDTLLRQLSQYAVLNLPGHKINKGQVLVSEFLNTFYRQYLPMAKAEGVTLIQEQIPQNLQGRFDAAQITQVLTNLLDNAFYACTESGRIRIGAASSEKGIVLFVTNTGEKIPEHLVEKIFDPLFRADPSRTRKTGGSGLGLAISRKIVMNHGGQIKVDDNEGETIFSVYLPS